jgi:carboxymethylenebutenolidase
MKTEDLELTVGDGTMAAFLAAPDAGASRAIIVIPEAFGLNDQIRNTARRIADAGIAALALDVFHRSGAPVAPYTDFAQVKALFAGLDDDAVGADIAAALAHLGDAGFSPDRTAIVGFCFGGRVSFLAALEHDLGAAISFYGGGIVEQGAFRAFPPLLDRAAEIRTPWIGFFGDRDRSIPADDVERLRATLEAATVPTEIVRYPDADHGFDCNERPSYDETASADAWRRAFEFLDRQLA